MSNLLEQIQIMPKTDRTLASLFEIIGGGTPKTTIKEYWNGNIPWLSVVDFNNDSRWVLNTEKKITEEGVKNSSTKILNKDDIIISARGTVGMLAQLTKPMAFNQSCYGIRAKNGVDQNYLFYLLKTSIPKLIRIVHGAVFDTITKDSFEQINISIPDLPTQKKIAEILSAYDEKIENNNKIIRNLEVTAQTIFNEWFINFRFPGYEKTKFIESEMEKIPEGWDVKKLEEVFDISIGRTPPRQEYQWFSRNPKDIKWVSIKDMGASGIYIHHTDEYLTKEAVRKFNIPLIPRDTLIVSFKLTIGRLAITTEEMLSNEAIAHFKNKLALISVEYVYLFLKKYNFDSLGSTSSIATAVNSKSIKSIQILVPQKMIMESFEKVIKPLFQKILLIQEENISLKSQRDQLLKKLIQ